MKTEILFINPGNHKDTYQRLSMEYTAIANPVWTLLLANHCRNSGFTTAIYDVNVEGWDYDSAGDLFEKYDPALIVLMVYGHNPSASTQTMPAAGRIVRDLKRYNRDVPIAMGGTHPSALPERTLQEEDIDYVIQGEGVYTITGLIEYLKGNIDKKKVPGLWFKHVDGVNCTTPAPLVENLDADLDGYAWDLIPPLSKYRAHNMHCFQYFEESRTSDFSDVRSPYASLYTSLGCPYSCSYCCINAIFGKPRIRYWSLEKVISWIDILVNKYHVKNLRIEDELFILSPNRVNRFCDLLIERGYDLNIWVYGRVDTIRESLLRKMRKAGITWICLGIESGNEDVMKNVNKRVSEDIKSIVKMIRDNGIYVLGNYMFGLPDDNLYTMEQTLRLAIELNCEFSNFYSVMAYPGSALYRQASQDGTGLPENWNGFSQHGYETRPMPTKYLSSEDVLRFRDYAFYKYHSNPVYLNMISQKFGEKVKRHIEKMLEIKIERKILDKMSSVI